MAVHLVDAHLCTDPTKYIAACLLSLSAMLHMELPHINVLSKADLLEAYGPLAFNLDFYTEVQLPFGLDAAWTVDMPASLQVQTRSNQVQPESRRQGRQPDTNVFQRRCQD